MRVLVVEDDDGVAESLEQVLTAHGFRAHRVNTGADALSGLTDSGLVLLDLRLPDLDGHEVCRRIRQASCVPVIAVSGRDEELDRVLALHMGADDFVATPFSRYELVARIRAVLRRSWPCAQHLGGEVPAGLGIVAPQAAPTAGPAVAPSAHPRAAVLEAGPIRLDPRTRRVHVHGEEVRVTRKEFDLLAMLLEAPGTVVARQDIMARVWDQNWFGSTRTLDVHVGSLRGKLGDAEWIETVRGVGYRLTVPTAVLA